jgi:hypothetical protein
MIETLFLIWFIGSCISVALIVYYFWPVQKHGSDYLGITLATVVGNIISGTFIYDS